MFFKFLIYLLIIVIIFRWLGFSLRILSAYRSGKHRAAAKQKPREGDVHITHKPPPVQKKINADEGEYVDFEEAKD